MSGELPRGRVLMLIYKYFSEDPRPLREASALLDEGYEVDVICVHRPGRREDDSREGLHFYSLPVTRKRSSKIRYLFEYVLFFLYGFLMCSWLHLRRRYKVVQVFVMPEALALACVIPKVLGARILVDWEDPSREVFLAKFEQENVFFLFLISVFEKMCVALANLIITPNQGFRRAFVSRGCPEEKIKIVMNGPDPKIFGGNHDSADGNSPDHPEMVILYHGTILHRHGLDTAIKALARVIDEIPEARLWVVGDGDSGFIETCRKLAADLGVGEKVIWQGRLPIGEIPALIGAARLGVVPNRENAFTRINFPQRILEYGWLRTPVVASRLPGIEDYMDDKTVCFFTPGDAEDLAARFRELLQDAEAANGLAERAYVRSKELEWMPEYLEIMKDLAAS